MKYKKSKLEYDKGCVGCYKPCQYNGLRVDAESYKAAKRDKYGMLVMERSALYGCNGMR